FLEKIFKPKKDARETILESLQWLIDYEQEYTQSITEPEDVFVFFEAVDYVMRPIYTRPQLRAEIPQALKNVLDKIERSHHGHIRISHTEENLELCHVFSRCRDHGYSMQILKELPPDDQFRIIEIKLARESIEDLFTALKMAHTQLQP
ncbi:MAG: hypothetical protein LRY46_00050, partial [Candidatus Pacebacteria bacterium]|nr:hypothetical protein [Candidatus Paceibacterota bacterium]